MMNLHNKQTKRIFAAVVVFILVIAMILPIFLSAF